MVRALVLSGLFLAAASPAIGQRAPASAWASGASARPISYLAGADSPGAPGARAHAFIRLRSELRELRSLGLALRAADGGTLAPEHLAFIQARLDAAQAAYRRYLIAPW